MNTNQRPCPNTSYRRRPTRVAFTPASDPHTELNGDSSGRFALTIHARPKTHYFDFQGGKMVWVVRREGRKTIETQHADELARDIYTVILKNHVRKNRKTPKTFYFRRIGESWVKTSL